MRDPHILRGPDGLFHMVWTSGWSDKGIGYANSSNLVDWSEQRYLPLMESTPGTKTCWAPEVYYEASLGQYLILWSSNVETPGVTPPKGGFHRAYYVLTKDFKTFTEPKIFFDPGFNNIDTTMLKVDGNTSLSSKRRTISRRASGARSTARQRTNRSGLTRCCRSRSSRTSASKGRRLPWSTAGRCSTWIIM
jgi:hypothetical protein